ncbi:methyltransferase [Acinetobacter sp. SFD]|uniref:class I SAM-dependent DNA methyltransferase n=1 Tax=Acinetobacter sp. SFD TaxID=1805635 RepID=UPI0007D0B2F5|nr:SAM-dependent methyltransferase [Acinetobacter sp. SFD]OAL85105.1 methyltransferase [Acinetobacter sp. SFD]
MNSNAAYDQEYFDALYALNQGDPWQYEQRWYEQRKRQICLALLPLLRFESAIEIGCSNGVFSQELAQRTDSLMCLDANDTAIRLARQRLHTYPHVQILQRIVPDNLPKQKFQLIVVSEILYYLNSTALDQVLTWLHTALEPGGCILSCHWRTPISGYSLNGEDIHQYLKAHLNHTHHLSLQDSDFLVDLWLNTAQSVAELEGLR